MTTIKGPPSQTPVSTTHEPAAPQTVTKPVEVQQTQAPHDGFETHTQPQNQAAAPTHSAPVAASVMSGLALIASLRKHPLFGTGARTKPLKPGEQSLGDHELDAAALAADLAGELEQDLADPGNDQNRRAAIAALFAGYPGGRDALAPIVP